MAELVRGKGIDAHGQAARAVFCFAGRRSRISDVQVTHVALPQALPALLGHLLAFGVVEHIEAAVLLGAEIIDEDLGDTDDATPAGVLGILIFLARNRSPC